jgi:hypothetical protein
MAGDWIWVRKELRNEIEVLRLATLTGLSSRVVVSILIDFWAWCDSVTTDGILKGITLAECPTICPDVVPSFWNHLVEVGWLVVREDGLAIPNFERWLGKCGKKRIKEAMRKRNYRQVGEMSRDSSAICPQSVRDVPRQRREEKRRDIIHPNPASGEKVDLPSDFQKFWSAYPAKLSQGTALRSWNRLAPDATLIAKILSAIERQKRSELWQRDGGRWILNPSHWLRRRCWEDETQPAPTSDAPCESTPDRLARIQRETAERREKYNSDAADPKLIRSKIRKAIREDAKNDAPSDSEPPKG